MAADESNTPEWGMFEAGMQFENLRMLFENIQVQVVEAEDNKDSGNFEAYTTAIEALCEMGARKCELAQKKIAEARHA